MRRFYKRCFCFFIFLLIIAPFSACSKPNEVKQVVLTDFWVKYVDVGQGDCAIIHFPDGKTMMIDCGSLSDFSISAIQKAIDKTNLTTIDYLVLTHPDTDHVGGAKTIMQKVSVKKVFVPEVHNLSLFPVYNSAVKLIEEKSIETIVSEKFLHIIGEDYAVLFLAPSNVREADSPYVDFNFSSQPNETQTNDISPFIYVEYKGVRFLFTGDAGEKPETKLIKDYKLGVFKNAFLSYDKKVDLENINFLKVSHHGSGDSSCSEFLSVIKPLNAIISVGGDNAYGHPASATLNRLLNANEKCNILRTDVKGSITVCVSDSGQVKVLTDK